MTFDLRKSELKRYPNAEDHDAEAPGRRALLTKQPAQFMRLPATSPFDAAARRGVATLAAVSVLGGSLFGSPGEALAVLDAAATGKNMLCQENQLHWDTLEIILKEEWVPIPPLK